MGKFGEIFGEVWGNLGIWGNLAMRFWGNFGEITCHFGVVIDYYGECWNGRCIYVAQVDVGRWMLVSMGIAEALASGRSVL